MTQLWDTASKGKVKLMPQPRMDIRMIKDIIRLKYVAKLSYQDIALSLAISKGAVTKYLSLAGAAQLDWNAVADMDEASLERRLLGRDVAALRVVEADFGLVHIELRRKGVTLVGAALAGVPCRPRWRSIRTGLA